MARLSGKNLACIRGASLVFENLSFDVEDEETLVLSGPNGSGKTSLLRLIAGLLEPAAGTISWNGHPGADRRGHIAWLGADNGLKQELTVTENLSFWASVNSAFPVLPPVLEKLNIAALADTQVRRLSTGQRRRVALARLLLSDKRLWLLDEPDSGLDSAATSALLALLSDHRKNGGIAVIASHDPALWNADTVLEIGGRS